MKRGFYLFFILTIFSCEPIRYINRPIDKYPCIGINSAKKIIIAQDKKFYSDRYYSNICIDGLVSNLKSNTSTVIIDEITFNQNIDSAILMELKNKYNADGLLLLTRMYEISSDEIITERYRTCLGCPETYYLVYNITVNSSWEYFDFSSGKTFGYFIENNQKAKWTYNKNNTDEHVNDELGFKEQMFFENGKISSKKLVGL